MKNLSNERMFAILTKILSVVALVGIFLLKEKGILIWLPIIPLNLLCFETIKHFGKSEEEIICQLSTLFLDFSCVAMYDISPEPKIVILVLLSAIFALARIVRNGEEK